RGCRAPRREDLSPPVPGGAQGGDRGRARAHNRRRRDGVEPGV
ncbi:hypothetical protein AVDCRST_MAG82-3611, partial [uncultured Rubrobacteraceae bacterium]